MELRRLQRRGEYGARNAAGPERKRPTYELIAETLRDAILQGGLPKGLVLTESALSGLFAASRSPVKQAFLDLEAQGLVRRFAGRGVVVGRGEAAPFRQLVTSEMLGNRPDLAETVRDDAWSTLYYALERDLILTSVFGRFRVNEVALARHCGVGRTVARNLLVRAQSVGLVSKADSSHWHVVEMNETRLRDLYDLRLHLEPCLAEQAAERISIRVLEEVTGRLERASLDLDALGVQELDRLEDDVHVTCLSFGRNIEMMEALKRTHCTLVIGKHIQTAIVKCPQIDPFMTEHLAILDALRAGKGIRAADALRAHLSTSCHKALDRLNVFRGQAERPDRSYLTKTEAEGIRRL